jgi:hypothetical protein
MTALPTDLMISLSKFTMSAADMVQMTKAPDHEGGQRIGGDVREG